MNCASWNSLSFYNHKFLHSSDCWDDTCKIFDWISHNKIYQELCVMKEKTLEINLEIHILIYIFCVEWELYLWVNTLKSEKMELVWSFYPYVQQQILISSAFLWFINSKESITAFTHTSFEHAQNSHLKLAIQSTFMFIHWRQKIQWKSHLTNNQIYIPEEE